MFKKIVSVLFVLMAAVMLTACGAPAPSGSGAKTNQPPAINGGTAITMAVNFPLKGVMPNAMISASTATLSIVITDGMMMQVGSGTIVAPAVGGVASTTINLNVSNSFTGPINIDVVSKDALGVWLGNVRLTNKSVVPQTNNTFAMTLVEAYQGTTIPLNASSPVLTSPDGSTYKITKIFMLPGGMSNYMMGIEASLTPASAAYSYTSLVYSWMTLPTTVMDGVITGTFDIANPVMPTSNTYAISLDFNDLTNNPTASASIIMNNGSASITNMPQSVVWTNGVSPSVIASTGVTVIVN